MSMTEQQAKVLLRKIAKVYPQHVIAKGKENATRDEYINVLVNMDFEKTDKAIDICINNCKSNFGFTIGEIKDIYSSILRNNFNRNEYKCSKCSGSGFVTYEREVEGRMYKNASRCDCLNSNNVNQEIPVYSQLFPENEVHTQILPDGWLRHDNDEFDNMSVKQIIAYVKDKLRKSSFECPF